MSELPKGWSLLPLGEIAVIYSGIGFPKKYQGNSSGYHPVYKVSDISRAYLNNKAKLCVAENYISENEAKQLKGKVFDKGAILFAKIGEALKLNRRVLVIKAGLADNNVMGVIPLCEVDSTFLYRFLQNFDIASLSRSTTIPSIRKSDVELINVPCPSIEEQKRIADKLDKMLEKVEAAQARLDKIPTILKRFRQSVLAAATSGELTKDWRDEAVSLGEQVDSCEIPNSWVKTTLDALSQTITSGSRGWASYYSDTGSIFIRAQNINSDELNLDDIAFVQLPERVEGRRTKVQKNDLLVTITGANVTKTARVKEDFDDAYVSQHVALIKLNDHSMSYFTEIFLKSPNAGRGELLKLAYGGGKPGLNLSNLKGLEIALPSMEEQKEIVKKVNELFSAAESVEKQYKAAKARLDNLTQSILAKAFRGELLGTAENDQLDRVKKASEAVHA